MRVCVHVHEVLLNDIKHNKFIVGRAKSYFSLPRGFVSFQVSC